ncbi:MAG: tRNA uridine-5-carboxymethylaminomethyl(34) synthesis GTPase MnmE [Gammaproteobacteria bacterium]|nr:tRNA uridine-5-carboxymethylaminomethyl(34) synthesis GTPase MnmE [Rhodocyclaceae bacterium]MBU3907737.1 tRNA uridine-5-carboxymethylaminomethyl(34) synthesis GTPase MnmE [Gammaproteobacteria bacterium]MBU3989831.1 tRNA uridine-5-carboxymethylaminomethyl(34) synthesis GTPase MnmE [Gammaproteobacteria bacterium]MBU4004383.1 tRNA uridine-5-carboxymethylaminomethyl(34) synthesis GTPase MnmE [Gammaproteobacteria bacterium]MBU4019792.1 tRNA uridine-5-carboxymethylaminomethyl(34) synthesis GTPase 
MRPADTIAAIATPPGRGGIGVVRVSGRNLLPMAGALTGKPLEAFLPRRATSADFLDADGALLDQGLLLHFPAPHSFTGEDVLELQGHGGPVVMHALLARCVELGARLAEPGEFSRRAFENDKIDLAQAEGIADLIEAASAQAARAALRSLSGEFSAAVHALTDGLAELRSLIEATLDFPDEEIDPLTDTDIVPRLARLTADLATLRARAREGSVLRSGLIVVLAGLPNVGKSSLLNRLAGAERAIVTEIAGTTRDAVRETIQVEGIPLHIIDTAGLRDTEDAVEKIGIERSWREIELADVILQIVDARSGVTPADQAVAARLPAGIERVVVENKSDLAKRQAGRHEENGAVHLVLSAKSGAGVALLHDELLRVAGWRGHGEDALLARARHLEALAEAAVRLAAATGQLGRLELAAEELRLAQTALSRITGEFTADDLLGMIFGRFCIGK